MVQPYDITTHDGNKVDWFTKVLLMRMEKELGYPLTVTQGSYNKGGVAASAGTHDKGGCVDLAAWDWVNKVRVGRKVGFAIWHRTSAEGPWSEHIHGVVIGHERLASLAAQQVTNYYNGTSGLKGQRRDTFPKPNPIPTPKWPGSAAALALETEMQALYKQWAKKADPPPPPPKTKVKTHMVDLSHWNTVTQAAVNQAAEAGVLGCYHKATEGTSYKDTTYSIRRGMVTRSKMQWSAYHFARLGSSGGAAQAKFFVTVAALKPGDLTGMLDLEHVGVPKGWTRAKITKWVGDWVAEYKRLVGVLPIIYLSQGIDLDDTFGCDLWVPRYNDAMLPPTVNKPWKQWTVWQYGQEQHGIPESVPGLGKIDRNFIKGDPAKVLDRLTIPGAAKPAPVPPSSTVELPLTRIHLGLVNVQQTDGNTAVKRLMDSLTLHYNIIVWNELGTLELQNYARDLKGWDTWVPGGTRDKYAMSGQVSISWRKSGWKPAAEGYSLHVVDAVKGVTPDRQVNSILLESTKTKDQVYILGGHAPHHVEEAGKWRVTDKMAGQNARALAYYRAVAAETARLKATGKPVVGAGDMNWDWFATNRLPVGSRQANSPVALIGKVARIAKPTAGTHGKRAIDWVWTAGEANVVRDVVLPRGSSDHNPRFVAIDI